MLSLFYKCCLNILKCYKHLLLAPWTGRRHWTVIKAYKHLRALQKRLFISPGTVPGFHVGLCKLVARASSVEPLATGSVHRNEL